MSASSLVALRSAGGLVWMLRITGATQVFLPAADIPSYVTWMTGSLVGSKDYR